ncbi:MAG: DUF4835 family protein [Melioribacteraceae bacterium]|nr:DUF4835 family protein [Melioribacteraceae bacterium]MDD3558895.1 DUF4835 family protein [Melioribacteraceae bacterium]
MKKLLFLFLFIPAVFLGQELNAKVEINYEQLPNEAKERLKNFDRDIQEYLNNNRFTDTNWEWERVNCNFTIFFMSADDTKYKAQLVVTSQRPIENSQNSSLMLNIRDDKWSFEYEPSQSMMFNLSEFDPLLSFLNYYAYVILGFDADSYNPNGGTSLFNKALDLCARGGSSPNNDGWELNRDSFNRRALIDDVLSGAFSQFREDYFEYHYNGLDIFNQDKNLAQKNIARLVNNFYEKKDMIDTRSVLKRVFFSAKSGEIVQYLSDYPDKEIFNKLMIIDPPNTSKYQQALN